MTLAAALPVNTRAVAPQAGPLSLGCIHCGETLGESAVAVPQGMLDAARLQANPENTSEPLCSVGSAEDWVCCVGCLAAMNFLATAQMPAAKDSAAVAKNSAYALWDRAELLAHAEQTGAGGYVMNLAVDAIHCPNCAWLIELTLQKLAPELRVSVDVPMRMLRLELHNQSPPLSKIVAALAETGYPVRLIQGPADRRQKNLALKQIFVAGMCTLQAMMFAEPLYWSDTDLPPQTAQFFAWLSALIALPAVSYAGQRFFAGARNELRLGKPAMDSLIALSVLTAFIGSMIGLLQGSQAVYFDAIAMFIFFLLLGRQLESMLMARARKAAMRLTDLMPAMATLASGEKRALHTLRVGDCLRAEIGEVLIADGILESESCTLSVAVFDGEAAPKRLLSGEPVYAGANVHSGFCVYRATALGANTQFAKIARASQESAAARTPSAEVTARMATRFTLTVLVLAICTSIFWWFIAPERALAVCLSVLIVACPCALGLALPLTRAMSHARLQRMGVILLHPDALDRLVQIDRVIFDKTGTLTAIDAHTLSVTTEGTLTDSQALGIARALEVGSTHPYAAPLTAAAAFADSPAYSASGIENFPGQGVRGVVNGQTWQLGSPAFSGLADTGQVVLTGSQASARFDFQEALRHGGVAAVAELASLGVAAQIISGDSGARVQSAATRLAINSINYRCTPAEKSTIVQAHKAAGGYSMMVGDGVNDAIALAGAHVAVSLGAANALARTHADVLLLHDDLCAVPELIRTARLHERIAKQNLLWARGYNLLAIPLAVMGFVGPGWAAIGMAASSLLVSLNAARLWPVGAENAPVQKGNKPQLVMP